MPSVEHAPAEDARCDITPAVALDVFCRAARQVALYTASHPAAIAALDDATAAFEAALGSQSSASLSVSGDTLLWNGKALPERSSSASELHDRLHRRLISSVLFHTGIERDDLAALLVILTQETQEIEAEGGAAKALQARQAQHCEIEEVDYTRYLRQSEIQWLETISGETREAGSAIQNLVGVCLASADVAGQDSDSGPGPAVSRPMLVEFGLPFAPPGAPASPGEGGPAPEPTTEEPGEIAPEDYLAISLANVIQRSGEVAASKPAPALVEWRQQVARAVRRLSPSLRARLFRAPVLIDGENPDLLADVARVFTASEIINIILGHPQAVVKEPSPQLALLLRRLVPDSQRRTEVEPILHSTLLSRGMSEDSYRNVVGLLLDHAGTAGTSSARTLEKQLKALAFPRDEAQHAEDVAELMTTLEPGNLTEARLLMLEELVDMDHEPAQFLELTRYLEQEAMTFAASGDTERLIRVIHALERQVQPDSPRSDTYRAAASRALRHIGSETVVARMGNALSTATPEQKCGIVRLLGRLGDKSVPLLVEEIRGDSGDEVKQAAVLALARMGGEGSRAIQTLLSDRDPDVSVTAMQTLANAHDDEVIKHLSTVLDRPDWRMRSELVRLLTSCEGAHAEHMLVRALLDDSLKVRAQAAESLGTRRATSAVAALSLAAERGPLHGDSLLLRRAAVTALGKIASHESIASLVRVLGKGSHLFRENSDAVRCLAAEALAKIPSPEAYEALELAQADRRPQVRQSCRAAAEEWRRTNARATDRKGAAAA